MPKEVFTAIYNRYETTLLSGKITALYNTEAAEDAVYPYGVFSLPSNVPDGTFTEYYEDYLIQFVLYSDETLATDLLVAFVALKAAFDRHDLVMPDAETISLERESANLIRVEGVWRFAITYRLLIQRSEIVGDIFSYGLPKTGQIIEYEAGDDGTYEEGWWRGRLNADNRTRFVSRTIDGDDVVLDLATGLMWPADMNEAGSNNGNQINWADGIAYANTLDFAGFTDWRIPNINELSSIVDWSSNSPAMYTAVFLNCANARVWTSTTSALDNSYAWDVYFAYGKSEYAIKTSMYFLRAVRNAV